MVNIRQTSLYVEFMRRINWQVEKVDGVYVFIKKLPLLPALVKIQRPHKLPNLEKLQQLMHKYRANSIVVEPSPNLQPTTYNPQLVSDPYIHTKSFHIDLTPSIETIFHGFTSAKRRGIRRAEKLGVAVEVSNDIEAFIKLKNRTAGLFLGFLTTHGFTRKLWQIFYPQHARAILAFLNHQQSNSETMKQLNNSKSNYTKKYMAGILLLYIDNIAYYWMAAASTVGKKHFAPTLLVWEAIKYAKSQGCTVFDFEGVYDERFQGRQKEWQGFSKFKEGFGGKAVYYPRAFKIRRT